MRLFCDMELMVHEAHVSEATFRLYVADFETDFMLKKLITFVDIFLEEERFTTSIKKFLSVWLQNIW